MSESNTDERVLILVEEALEEADVDVEQVQAKLDKALALVESSEDGSEEHKRAERDARRYRVFLEIVGSKTAA